MPAETRVHMPSLPGAATLKQDFTDTAFFQRNKNGGLLPSPEEVRFVVRLEKPSPKASLVRFEDLGLMVKFGPNVLIEEAQNLWAVNKALIDVPVPELYGWRIDGGEVFIYMELIHAATLETRWKSLDEEDKTAVCSQLREMVISLRTLKQFEEEAFIGSLNRGALTDYVFERIANAGPFAGVREFNDWFSQLSQKRLPLSERFVDPYRSGLPDDGAIHFTHGDLHRENILISQVGPPRILAIIDWAHAGWYPDYWEYCKAAYTSWYGGSWRKVWIPKFLSPRVEVHDVFGYYTMAIGAV